MNSHVKGATGKGASKRGRHGAVLARLNKQEAQQLAESLRPEVIKAMLKTGKPKGGGPKAIAAYLNAQEVPTARGGKWHPETVRRLLKQLEPGLETEFRDAWREQGLRRIAAKMMALTS